MQAAFFINEHWEQADGDEYADLSLAFSGI